MQYTYKNISLWVYCNTPNIESKRGDDMRQHIKNTLKIIKILGLLFFLYFALRAIYIVYL